MIRIAVSMGDPYGIGPEVLVKALADPELRSAAHWTIYGSRAALRAANRHSALTLHADAGPDWTDSTSHDSGVTLVELPEWTLDWSDDVRHGPTAESGRLSWGYVNAAIDGVLAGKADGVVTGPISKDAWFKAGHTRFPGHTELLAERCGIADFGMMFHSPRLNVILATAHIPLMSVADRLSIEGIARTIRLGHRAMLELGSGQPRIAVCGLNPHAGEGGLFGSQDASIIAPAIEHARRGGIDASGPFPADTIFNAAVAGRYELVVAMYHDQGLIPLKLLARDEAVNMTVGLPIIRTSPDHGTAYDIAGRNVADPGSMKAAMRLAVRLAVSRAGSLPRKALP